ncbi:MAG: glycosyltransferase, partial [Deltaproteobacteria bacterium]|nr:glycosyltransferase [Deltaproteobacteria bacterium]
MKFSVIIPSYNQGEFIERTIQSVLNQAGSFHIEYAIVDGCSSDGTVAILSNYEKIVDGKTRAVACDGIAFSWVSEKDSGQADAVNKGIACTSGEIIAWINSDDIYYPGAFEYVRQIFQENRDIDLVYGLCNHIDEHDGVIEFYPTEPWNYDRLFEKCYICQPGTFFRRKLIDEYGPLDASLRYCMDYELWLRFGKSARFFYLEELLAGSRMYSANKTLGQRVAVHNEINKMFLEKFGEVPRKWIYGYAEVVAEEKQKKKDVGEIDLDLVREIAQDAFLKWRGCIPVRELDYMDKFLSNPGTKMWPVRRRLKGLEKFRIGFDVSGMSTCDDFRPSTQMMINTMANKYPDIKFILYKSFGSSFFAPKYSESDSRIKKPNVQYALTDLNDTEAQHFWSALPQYVLASLGYPDIIHCNNFFCPDISGAKIVYTLYDLSFLDCPEFSTPDYLSVCKNGVDDAARYADIIIASSDHTRTLFLQHYPEFPESRIRTVDLPKRFEQILENLDRVGSDKELSEASKHESLSQASKVSWEKAAEQIHDIYEELIDLPKRQSSGANDFYSISRLEKNRTLAGRL